MPVLVATLVGACLHDPAVSGGGHADYLTIQELIASCGIPAECGKASPCEGQQVMVKGYLDYVNIFDKKMHPQLPQEKFRMIDGPEILKGENPWASYTQSLEIYPVSGDTGALFERLRQQKGLPLIQIRVKGTVKGVDQRTNVGCRRGIYLTMDAQDISFDPP